MAAVLLLKAPPAPGAEDAYAAALSTASAGKSIEYLTILRISFDAAGIPGGTVSPAPLSSTGGGTGFSKGNGGGGNALQTDPNPPAPSRSTAPGQLAAAAAAATPPPHDRQQRSVESVLSSPEDYQGLIFTSANAVKAVQLAAARLKTQRPLKRFKTSAAADPTEETGVRGGGSSSSSSSSNEVGARDGGAEGIHKGWQPPKRIYALGGEWLQIEIQQ